MEQGALGIALVALIVISSVLAVVYIGRIVEQLWFGEALLPGASSDGRKVAAAPIREAPVVMLVVTYLAVAANFWFGLDASLPSELAARAAEDFLRHVR